MPMNSASSGGAWVCTQLWICGMATPMSHSSGWVYTVVRFSVTSQNRLGSAMRVSKKAAAGLGTAPPSRSFASALTCSRLVGSGSRRTFVV